MDALSLTKDKRYIFSCCVVCLRVHLLYEKSYICKYIGSFQNVPAALCTTLENCIDNKLKIKSFA